MVLSVLVLFSLLFDVKGGEDVAPTFRPVNRIQGGYDAAIGEFPHQVSLQVDNNHVCGGTILSEKWVLTAGHCVEGHIKEEPSILSVKAGGITFDDPNMQTRTVQQVFINDYYGNILGRMTVHDIALLKLKEPFDLNGKEIGAAQLPQEKAEYLGNMTISGWGGDGINVPAPTLQKAILNFVPVSECAVVLANMTYPADKAIPHTWLCAINKDEALKSACRGDSGGPLVHIVPDAKAVVVGVTSFIMSDKQALIQGCFTKGKMALSVYTKVSFFICWIQEVMKGF